MKAGRILSAEAYAQGKMLDHSGWSGHLPRGITPSDIDCVIADGMNLVLVELSSNCTKWEQISVGQRRLYTDIVKRDPDRTVAVLAKHCAGGQLRQIDTVKDITSFEVMFGVHGDCGYFFADSDGWLPFVRGWFEKREEILYWLRREHAKTVNRLPREQALFPYHGNDT